MPVQSIEVRVPCTAKQACAGSVATFREFVTVAYVDSILHV